MRTTRNDPPATAHASSSRNSTPTPSRPERIGPILFARGADDAFLRLSAIIVLPEHDDPPSLTTSTRRENPAKLLQVRNGCAVWRYDFVLPVRADATYRLGSAEFPVAADISADVRLAYVSCNGQEHGDAYRPADQRNEMWRRLAAEHQRAPFSLLLHGGDQLYADDVLRTHAALSEWAAGRRQQAAPSLQMYEVAESYYFDRYLTLFAQPEFAFLSARVPSIMMWDDHDIVDGWGSLPAERLDSEIGRALFAIARRAFVLFQLGATENTLPGAIAQGSQQSLTQAIRFPGLSVIAPDLRSERRPTCVLGEEGWRAFEQALLASPAADRILIMSSVPILGPRLSWIEKLFTWFPGAQKYEDDLRDQWQSRWHRAEWQRVLRLLVQHSARSASPPTILSGEIHFATRGEMPCAGGTLHQLVASGVAHPPPPRLYATCLGMLASLGEQPLPDQPVRLKPIPGRHAIYTAERNYLVLERHGETWLAAWELERSGCTPALPLA